jgi:hypothetical protein
MGSAIGASAALQEPQRAAPDASAAVMRFFCPQALQATTTMTPPRAHARANFGASISIVRQASLGATAEAIGPRRSNQRPKQ